MAEKIKGVELLPGGGESSFDRRWAEERLRTLAISPKDLPAALEEFFELATKVQDAQHGPVVFGTPLESLARTKGVNRVSRVPPGVLERMKQLHNEGNSVEAVLVLSESLKLSQAVPRGTGKAIRELRAGLQAALPREENERVRVKGPRSRVFDMGRGSHDGREKLELSGGDLSKLERPQVKLVNEGNSVTKVVFGEEAVDEGQTSFEIRGEDDPQFIEVGIVAEGELFEVILEEPLPLFREEQSVEDWVLEILVENLRAIEEEVGMPKYPRDTAKILENDRSRKALVRGLEVAHILFGPLRGMNLVTEEEPGRGRIGAGPFDSFNLLNWLSLMSATVKMAQEFKKGGGRKEESQGRLVELQTADLKIEHGEGEEAAVFWIKGGTLDLMETSWVFSGQVVIGEGTGEGTSEEPHGETAGKKSKEISLWPARVGLTLAEATEWASKMFGSQQKRFWRESLKEGRLVTKRTELGKTLRSYFQILWRCYGERLFTDLQITNGDFKFPSGDAGMWLAVNVDELPIEAHKEQVDRYLFWIIAQLCWVKKWSQGEGEDFALKVEDVVEFARKYRQHRILGRVRGEIRYQLPEGEKIEAVVIKNEDELADIGSRLFDQRRKARKRADERRFLEALRVITSHRQEEIRVVQEEPREIPEPLRGFCSGIEGRPYLVVERFANQLFEPRPDGEQRPMVKRAIVFGQDGVFVLWVRGLLGGKETLRIGVGEDGQFAISGLGGGMVRGRLADEKHLGAVQSGDRLMTSFQTEVLTRLKQEGVEVEEAEAIEGEGRVIYPNGEVKDVVFGKPRVVRQNRLTGRWSLDLKALEQAVDTQVGMDRFDAQRIYDALSRRSGRKVINVLCPLPGHPNLDRRSRAAALYLGPPPFIKCFALGCRQIIDIHLGHRRLETRHFARGESPEDFRSVSRERKAVFGTTIEIGQILARHYQEGREYLVEARGLDPAGLDPWGYCPEEYAETMANLTETRRETDSPPLGRGLVRLIKEGGADLRLDQVSAYVALLEKRGERVEHGQALVEEVERLLEFINHLPSWDDQRQLKNLLTLGTIRNLASRGVVGRSSEGNLWLSGRIILPSYWLEKRARGWQPAMANIITRGITLGEKNLYQGEAHLKAFISQPTKRETRVINGVPTEVLLLSTPAGFWVRDMETFLSSVEDMVVVFEGWANQASFAQMKPEYRDQCCTIANLDSLRLIAFLRWLGVEGDQVEFKGGRRSGVRRICLATDFDGPGTEGFFEIKESLESAFPGVDVFGVHELLPPDVRELAYPYDRELFTPAGPHFGEKQDMNELLLMPELEHYRYIRSENPPALLVRGGTSFSTEVTIIFKQGMVK